MKSFATTAVWNKTHYYHFGIHPNLASIYGDKPEDIVSLEMIPAENQELPADEIQMEVDYWGWYDERQQRFTLIFPKRFLLNMCFPYGMKAEEDLGRGKSYRLQVLNHKITGISQCKQKL